MRTLVVGGSGFVGSRVLDALVAAGHDVANLDVQPSGRRDVAESVGDVRDLAAVGAALAGREAVVVLAAQHQSDEVRPLSLYESINVGGAQVVTEAASAAGVGRVVLVSTAAVYGASTDLPDEHTPPQPHDEFSRTKLAAEQVFTAWAAADDGRSLTIVRPAVVFGEGDPRRAPDTLNGLVSPILHRRFVPVGRGRARRSVAYVGNLAAFLAGRLDAPPGTTIVNFADKPDLTAGQLVAAVRGSAGLAARRWWLPVPLALFAGWVADTTARLTRHRPVGAVRWVRSFVAEATIDTTRLSGLGYRPAVPLDVALERTLRDLA